VQELNLIFFELPDYTASTVDESVMNEMEGNKTYSQPKGFILDTIYDIIELQNGKLILSDAIHGRVHYHVSMYGYTWELMYTVAGMGKNRSNVTLSVCGERQDLKKEVRRHFALLDSLLEGGASVKLIGAANHIRKS